MDFKEWLKIQEAGTNTACIAVFARPALPGPVRRVFASHWGKEDPFFKKRKRKRGNK